MSDTHNLGSEEERAVERVAEQIRPRLSRAERAIANGSAMVAGSMKAASAAADSMRMLLSSAVRLEERLHSVKRTLCGIDRVGAAEQRCETCDAYVLPNKADPLPYCYRFEVAVSPEDGCRGWQRRTMTRQLDKAALEITSDNPHAKCADCASFWDVADHDGRYGLCLQHDVLVEITEGCGRHEGRKTAS